MPFIKPLLSSTGKQGPFLFTCHSFFLLGAMHEVHAGAVLPLDGEGAVQGLGYLNLMLALFFIGKVSVFASSVVLLS